MGYEVFVYKFEEGEPSGIPRNKLGEVLFKYGTIEEGSFGLEFCPTIGDICDYSSLSTDEEGEILCVQFSRPTMDEKLKDVIFDLLGIKNTCFFGPDLEFLQSRSDMAHHLPESLVEEFPDGLQIIESSGENWPLV